MLIKNATYYAGNNWQNADIQVNDGLISNISIAGDAAKIADKGSTLDVFDASAYYIIPGLINTHTHIGMTHLRGIADDLPLDRWLTEVIFPREEKEMSFEFVKKGSTLGAKEMLANGITTIVDMYYLPFDMAKIMEKLKLPTFIGIGPDNLTDETIAETEKLMKEVSNNNFIHPTVFAHAIYTTPEEKLLKVKKFADKWNIPYQFHLLETKDENENFKKQSGIDLLPYLEKIGFLSGRLIAAHCVWATDKDIEILKKYNVTISHNPHSNLKLNSGIMPLKKMLDEGLNVTLGTDSAASNNALSLFREMDLAAKLYYHTSGDPIHPQEIFKMATVNAAKAIGMADRLGVIKKYTFANLVFINKNHYSMQEGDPISNLVFASPERAIEKVMINGEFV